MNYKIMLAIIGLIIGTILITGCTFAQYKNADGVDITYMRGFSDNTLSGLVIDPNTGQIKLDSSQTTVRDELLLEAIKRIP